MNKIGSFLKKHYPWFVLALAVFLAVTFASQCSFLYRMNEWNDVHCYYTVGMMMREGKVLYRDIMEQKGPYLYFIHLAAIAISPGKYWGMYLFELVYGWIFAYATYRTLRLFITHRPFAVLGTCGVLVAYYVSFAFMQGDSVEELMVPFFALTLYWLIKMAKGLGDIPWWKLILTGAFAGLALFCKFPLIAFYAGFGGTVFVLLCIRKQVGKAFLDAGLFLVGLGVSAIPALAYFASNNTLSDLWQTYFYDNIFHYSSAKSMGAGERILGYLSAWVVRFGFGYSYFIPILFGFFYAVFSKRIKKDRVFFSILAPYCALNLALVVGGVSYAYYGLPNAAFAFIGVVALDELIRGKPKFKAALQAKAKPLLGGAAALLCVVSFAGTPNMSRMFVAEKDIMQYQMKAVIEKENNATLLNYGVLDAGVYYLCDIQPTTKYFCGLNGDFAELKAEQQRIVDEGLVTFVLANSAAMPERIDVHYAQVYSFDYRDMWGGSTYYLYKLKA